MNLIGSHRTAPSYPNYRESGQDWAPLVPSHWVGQRLKWTVTSCQNGIWGEEPDGQHELPCIRVTDFDRIGLRVGGDEPTIRSITPSQRTGRLLRKGDLLLEKSGGGQQQRVGLVVQYDKEGPGVCSNFVARMSVAPRYDSRFLTYLHAALYSGGINIRSIKQTTGIQNLDSQQYLDERVSVPPEPEQRAIAAFLDRETARIDVLTAKKERLLELLEEKRSALISQAVTKGLDPSVPMKESGVEWIGLIPTHWSVLPLRRVVNRFVDYRGQTPEKKSTGVPLVTAKNIADGRIDFAASEEYIDPADYDDWMVRGLPAKGDVLLTTEAPLGGVAQVVDPHIALAQRIILFKVDPRRMTNDFLKYAFLSLSGMNDLQSRGTGSTAIGIKATRLREVLVTVPPVAEQEVLTRELDRRLGGFASTADTILTAIARVREYRTTLITAAVTGQIDVRGEGRQSTG